jgi:hypothetical protein
MNFLIFSEQDDFSDSLISRLTGLGHDVQCYSNEIDWKPESIISIRKLIVKLERTRIDRVVFIPASIPHVLDKPSDISTLSSKWITGYIQLILELHKFLDTEVDFLFFHSPQNNLFSKLHQAALKNTAEELFLSERRVFGYVFSERTLEQLDIFLKYLQDNKKNQPDRWLKLAKRGLF